MVHCVLAFHYVLLLTVVSTHVQRDFPFTLLIRHMNYESINHSKQKLQRPYGRGLRHTRRYCTSVRNADIVDQNGGDIITGRLVGRDTTSLHSYLYRATACTATHGRPIANGLSVRPSVCPSARLSNACMDCDKTKETSAHILIPYERSFILVFWQEEWLVEATPSTWNFGPNWPCYSEHANFKSIFAHSASTVTPGEHSSINTNRKSIMCFQWA